MTDKNDIERNPAEQIARNVSARCTAMRVHRASRLLTRRYDEAMRPAGLTITQFTLLNTIALRRPKSISDIGTLLDIDRTTLSRSLSLLQNAGLVALGEPGPDRRREVMLTADGEAKLSEAYEKWQTVQNEVEAMLAEAELAALESALAKLRGVE